MGGGENLRKRMLYEFIHNVDYLDAHSRMYLMHAQLTDHRKVYTNFKTYTKTFFSLLEKARFSFRISLHLKCMCIAVQEKKKMGRG